MKLKSGLLPLYLVIVFLITLSARAAEETIVLSDFNLPGEWNKARWNKAEGRVALRPEVPPALAEAEDAPDQSLGVKVNWPGGEGFRFFNVVPATSEPIPYQTKELLFWYSGSGTGHYLVVVIEDANGKSHKLSVGRMDSTDWKQARLRIPAKVAQPFKILNINQHDYGMPQPAESTAYFSRLSAVVDTEKPLGGNAAGAPAQAAGNRKDDW